MTEVSVAVGQWAVFAGSYGGKLSPDVAVVEKVTAKQIVAKVWSYPRRFDRAMLLAAFDDGDQADRLKQALDGVRGERDRRRNDADRAANAQADAVIRKALA